MQQDIKQREPYLKAILIGIATFLVFTAIFWGHIYLEENELKTVKNRAYRGDVDAQIQLAGMYLHGKFAPKRRNTAKAWYMNAAFSGSKYAKDILCSEFKTGCEHTNQ